MNPIFFLAGAPAVGKSTAARALAAKFPKSMHISVDTLRDMVISGAIHPSGDWSSGLVEQLSLARASAMQMAISYNQAGFVVIIDDFWDPHGRLLEYSPLFQEPNVYKILLLPSRQAAEERNRKRAGDEGEYHADGIRMVYDHLQNEHVNLKSQGWIIVDTTEKSIESTVVHIRAQVN
jgi:chloramphenicol 3-O-phosphotransferase